MRRDFDRVYLTARGAVAVITLNHPEVVNAISPKMVHGLLDALAFVNDKDKQSWDISNPDAVKGHEGHHVKVSAKLDEANHSITVDKLSMMKKSKQAEAAQPKS